MVDDLRLGKRIKLSGPATISLPDEPESWTAEGYDLSPTAVALLVDAEHEAMKLLPQLFVPGTPLLVEHEKFGRQRCVLHRVFRHRDGKTKWVLSFLRALQL